MRNAPARAALFLLSILTVTLAAGCDPGAELDGEPGAESTEEAIEQAIQYTHRDVPVGNGYVRKLKLACGKVCVKRGLKPAKPRPVYGCLQEAVSCDAAPSGAVLFENAATLARDEPFAAYNGGQEYDYMGCGRSAVLNVLGYFGMPITMNVVKDYVTVSKFGRFWKDELGSYDNWVADGLRTLLDNFHPDNFTVEVHNWTDVQGTVMRELRAGNPVIMLVNGGSHWVTAIGYEGSNILTIDYPWAGITSKPFYEMGTTFEDGGDFISWGHGWKSNTVITIHRN